MSRTKAEQALHVVRWIESHSIVVPPDSRLSRMRDVFVRSDGTPAPTLGPDHPDLEIALEALRDLQMLSFAFDQLSGIRSSADFKRQLRTTLKDVVLPQDDLRASQGRDAQCELYVAAACTKAGMNPVFAEPDVRCSCAGALYGVAVKRIKSYDKLEERIRGAVKQIQRASLRGIVVADVSVMLNPKNERIINPITDEQFGAVASFTLHKFVDDHLVQLSEWVKGTEARGIILIDHHVRQHPTDGWGLETMTFGVNLSPYNQRRRREFDRFFDVFKRGTATPPVASQ